MDLIVAAWESIFPYAALAADPAVRLVSGLIKVLFELFPHLHYNIAYVLLLFWMYLFHSPFRVRSSERLDWYAQITKVVQTWCILDLMIFHVVPTYLKRLGGGEAGAVFFPMFAVASLFLVIQERVAFAVYALLGNHSSSSTTSSPPPPTALPISRLKSFGFRVVRAMKVSYAPTFTLWLLNSLLVALVATGHYAYCVSVSASLTPGAALSVFDGLAVYAICPDERKGILWVLFVLSLDIIVFLAVDLGYKSYNDSDVFRGLLFCESVANHRRRIRAGASVDGDEVAVETTRRHVGDVGTSDEDEPTKAAVVAAATAFTAAAPGGGGDVSISSSSIQHLIAARRVEMAKAPNEPPDPLEMVPWYSALIASTALQLFVGSKLTFGRFDYRTMESQQGPKIFRLRNAGETEGTSSANQGTAAVGGSPTDTSAASAGAPLNHSMPSLTLGHSAPLSASAGAPRTTSPPHMPRVRSSGMALSDRDFGEGEDLHHGAAASQSAGSLHRHRRSQNNNNRGAPGSSAGSPAPQHHAVTPTSPLFHRVGQPITNSGTISAGAQEPFYFDFTADVGDGYNSSYAIARLLAQPQLKLQAPATSSTKASRLSMLKNLRKRSIEMITPLLPLKPDGSSAMSFAFAAARGRPSTGTGGHLPTSRTMADLDDSAASPGSLLHAPTTSTTRGRQSSSPSAEPPGSARRTHSADRARTHLSRVVASPADDKLTLPRGSVLILGGDLAYPSPTDDIYRDRFYRPFCDALPPSVAYTGAAITNDTIYGPGAALPRKRAMPLADMADSLRAETIELPPSSSHSLGHRGGPGHNEHVSAANTTSVAATSGGRSSSSLAARRSTAGSPSSPADEGRLSHGDPAAASGAPLMFAIPGNHDWIDGLDTFRSTVLTLDRFAGWASPQRTSYFAVAFPVGDWWLFGLDLGLVEDIDPMQMQYFLDVIGRVLSPSANVILLTHEPNWVLDCYHRPGQPSTQPRAQTVRRALGTRLRMCIAGDVHNYTRYEVIQPQTESGAATSSSTPSSFAATATQLNPQHASPPVLVVSGGGGAFAHGTTLPGPTLPYLGHTYQRKGAFPDHAAPFHLATRVFGFRLVNWQFDLVGGVLYYCLVAPLVTVQLDSSGFTPDLRGTEAVLTVLLTWLSHTCQLLGYLFTETTAGCALAVGLTAILCATVESKLPAGRRMVIGLTHSAVHIIVAVSLLALLHIGSHVLLRWHMVDSTAEKWSTAMGRHILDVLTAAARLGGPSAESLFNAVCASRVGGLIGAAFSSLDFIEGAIFLSEKVVAAEASGMAVTRSVNWLFHGHVLLFYWMLAAPAVAAVVGLYLCVCVTVFGCCWDATYSAFRIEDFKHFIRFKIHPDTHILEGFVIALDKVPRSWERDPNHEAEVQGLLQKAAAAAGAGAGIVGLSSTMPAAVNGEGPSVGGSGGAKRAGCGARGLHHTADASAPQPPLSADALLPQSHSMKHPSVWRPKLGRDLQDLVRRMLARGRSALKSVRQPEEPYVLESFTVKPLRSPLPDA